MEKIFMEKTEKKSPFLTVVIPCYNVALYLKDCLDSLFENDTSMCQVICVDDGSTDATAEILKEYKKSHPIEIITQKNKGLSGARNSGMKKALGTYIYFFDSDDVIKNNFMETVIPLLQKEKPDILQFNFKGFFDRDFGKESDGNGRGLTFSGLTIENGQSSFTGKELFCKMAKNEKFVFSVWTKIFKKDFLVKNNISFIEGIYYEDVHYLFETFMKAKKVFLCPEVLYSYRVRENSIMTKKITEKNFYSYFVTMEVIFNLLKTEKLSAEEEFAVETFFATIQNAFYDKSKHSSALDLNSMLQTSSERIFYNAFVKSSCLLRKENEEKFGKRFIVKAWRKVKKLLGK